MIEISAIVLSPKEADDTLKFVKKQQAEIDRLTRWNATLQSLDKTILDNYHGIVLDCAMLKEEYRILRNKANAVLGDVDAVNKWTPFDRMNAVYEGINWMSVKWLSDLLRGVK